MAALILTRRYLALSFRHKLLCPALGRPFTAEASPKVEQNSNDDGSPRDGDSGGGGDDPFFPARLSLDRMLVDGWFGAAMSKGIATAPRMDFDCWDDDARLYVRIDMPGLGREDVEVSPMEETLVITGRSSQDVREGEVKDRAYSCRIRVPATLYNMNELKVDMKNGVLKIVVPKVKVER